MAFAADVSLEGKELCFKGPFQEAQINVPAPAQNQRIPGAARSEDLGVERQASMASASLLQSGKAGIKSELGELQLTEAWS